MQFKFGSPFTYELRFYSEIRPPGERVAQTLPEMFREEEGVDCTVTLVGVSITDKDGRELSRLTVTSESGVEYKIVPRRAGAE
jgi:hypothetical protein